MDGDADVAAAARLIAVPARAALLQALTEEDRLAARELAARANVSPSTASAHLAKLTDAGLVLNERRGRHRYFRLADRSVAVALEALSAIAPAQPVRSLSEASAAEAIRAARTCYDHLAGRLGVELAAALERKRVLVYEHEEYALGPGAASTFGALGLDLDRLAATRRRLLRSCLDWSERRRHLAGALGAALADRLFALGLVAAALVPALSLPRLRSQREPVSESGG